MGDLGRSAPWWSFNPSPGLHFGPRSGLDMDRIAALIGKYAKSAINREGGDSAGCLPTMTSAKAKTYLRHTIIRSQPGRQA